MSLPQAFRWSFLSELASRAITPAVFIVLARLLTPEDFGVVAAAAMVISFSQVFWEAGLSKALIQYDGDVQGAANAAFWINCGLGCAVALILVLASDVLAKAIFHDDRIALVLKVMSIQVLLGAAGSVHTAYLQKEFKFRSLFWIRLLTVAVPGLVSIPLALRGADYWALIIGTIAGQLAQLLLLWRNVAWKPTFTFDGATALRLMKFGSWVAVSGILGWFYLWADSLTVGLYLGAHELGLYRTGNTFVIMVYGVLFSPLLPVLYSHLAGIQNDRPRVTRTLQKTIQIVALTSLPMAFLIYAFAEPIARLVFGVEWTGIGAVIAVLSLTHGFGWLVGFHGEAYRAVGRPEFETKVMASTVLVYSLAYWLSIRHSFQAFLWARFAVALIAIAVHFWVAKVAIALPIRSTAVYVLRIAILGIPLIALEHYLGSFASIQMLMVAGALAMLWAGSFLWFVERNSLIPEILGMVRGKWRGGDDGRA